MKKAKSHSFANDGRGPKGPSSISQSERRAPRGRGLSRRFTRASMRRCHSLPLTRRDVRGIMKTKTLDESLKRQYGSETRKSKNAGIQFDKIIIREYARTVGDNPSVSSGPPVSISWEYQAIQPVSLDDYENTRPPRRSNYEMVLPRGIRQHMLKSVWEVRQGRIAASVRQVIRTKNQRKSTVTNLGKATKMEEVWESICRKLKRLLTFQKSVSAQVRDLEKSMTAAEKERAKHRMEIMMSEDDDGVDQPRDQKHSNDSSEEEHQKFDPYPETSPASPKGHPHAARPHSTATIEA